MAVLLAGWGQSPAAYPSPVRASSTEPAYGETLLLGGGTVLDSGRGPELCLGPVLASYPPQCGGPQIVGWRWPEEGVERAAGVTWGVFGLLGTYDGRRFTLHRLLTRADAQQVAKDVSEETTDFASPCPEPPGGWCPLDPARTTQETQSRAFWVAAALPDYADAWLDDRGDRRRRPTHNVVNVRVTDDVAGAETAVRAVWGGSLCVTKARHSRADLDAVEDAVSRRDDMLTSESGRDRVDLSVIYDDGSIQRAMDASTAPDWSGSTRP